MQALTVLGVGLAIALIVACQMSDHRALGGETSTQTMSEMSMLDQVGGRLGQAAQNLKAVAGGSAHEGTAGIVDPEGQVHNFIHAGKCEGQETRLSPETIHSPAVLLPWLAFERGDLSTGLEPALHHWLVEDYVLPPVNRIRTGMGLESLVWTDVMGEPEAWARGVAPAHHAVFNQELSAVVAVVDAPKIFAYSLGLAYGEVYLALLTAHNVRRTTRIDPGVQTVLVPLRHDNSGAYYHLFGMATYAVAYDLAGVSAESDIARAGLVLVSPEIVATIEETLISESAGDVGSDPTEYAIDLLGAQIGRAVAQVVQDEGSRLC